MYKRQGERKTFAPTTDERFSIVPNNYEAGLIEVNEKSCHRCHKDANHPVRHFNPDAILYGNVWGDDQIFSFHPWDQSLIHGSADDNRRVNPAFVNAGIVSRKRDGRHDASLYQELPDEYSR